jgi:hypothetical protein
MYDLNMKRLLYKINHRAYIRGWNHGLSHGADTALDTVISMLQRELYKNKGEDVYYEYAIKAVIKKIEDMKND